MGSAEMTTTHTRSPTRVVSLLAVGLVTVVAMLGCVLVSAPQASADCVLTAQDQSYIQLLAQKHIGAINGYTDCDVAGQGRWFADKVRASATPALTAAGLARTYYWNYWTSLTEEQAAWQVAAAIKVYAPEMVPAVLNTNTPPQPVA
jgi:Protein of unknown function (DUF732)